MVNGLMEATRRLLPAAPEDDDFQQNSRMGLTLAVPLKGSSAFKVSWARGVTTSVGGKFDALAVAYQFLWF